MMLGANIRPNAALLSQPQHDKGIKNVSNKLQKTNFKTV